MKPIIYRSSIEDALQLAPQLRAEDVAEVRAASGKSPLVALQFGIEHSECYSAADADGVFAMFGLGANGSIWLLASDRLLNHKIFFLRESLRWFNRWHERHEVLWNLVDCRNTVHIQWLKWVGCSFELPIPNGPDHLLFQRFNHVRPSNSNSHHGRSTSRSDSNRLSRTKAGS